jgi:hypothetical protein
MDSGGILAACGKQAIGSVLEHVAGRPPMVKTSQGLSKIIWPRRSNASKQAGLMTKKNRGD